MGGESGNDLVGGIMNTVQTSSLPAETAGKAGTPNTGAEAGDAQGQDTGKVLLVHQSKEEILVRVEELQEKLVEQVLLMELLE